MAHPDFPGSTMNMNLNPHWATFIFQFLHLENTVLPLCSSQSLGWQDLWSECSCSLWLLIHIFPREGIWQALLTGQSTTEDLPPGEVYPPKLLVGFRGYRAMYWEIQTSHSVYCVTRWLTYERVLNKSTTHKKSYQGRVKKLQRWRLNPTACYPKEGKTKSWAKSIIPKLNERIQMRNHGHSPWFSLEQATLVLESKDLGTNPDSFT